MRICAERLVGRNGLFAVGSAHGKLAARIIQRDQAGSGRQVRLVDVELERVLPISVGRRRLGLDGKLRLVPRLRVRHDDSENLVGHACRVAGVNQPQIAVATVGSRGIGGTRGVGRGKLLANAIRQAAIKLGQLLPDLAIPFPCPLVGGEGIAGNRLANAG